MPSSGSNSLWIVTFRTLRFWPASPEEFTRRVKGFARYLGARLVGTTKLNPAYVYSHIGRSPGQWGDPIRLDHTHAVAAMAAAGVAIE